MIKRFAQILFLDAAFSEVIEANSFIMVGLALESPSPLRGMLGIGFAILRIGAFGQIVNCFTLLVSGGVEVLGNPPAHGI